jgi:hypothetical protein
MDPLSITASVIGILGAVTTLSIRINDLRETFIEAQADIEHLLSDLNGLSIILTRLRETNDVDHAFPPKLSEDLMGVLENCRKTAIEAELHLERSAKKTLRGVAWTFSGKKRFLAISRRMDSQKQTVNIALNMALA